MKTFLNYTEIQTKITSVLTFILTLGVLRFNRLPINWLVTGVFFAGMFLFDLTTTAINNYIDSKTNGQDIGYSRTQGKAIIFGMLAVSIGLGIYLVILSDLLILLVGMLCFGVGILYTWGPIPISRQPYGEIISGVMYGYFIPFIMIHANAPGYLVSFAYYNGTLTLGFEIVALIYFVIIFMTPTVLTASIMLANNTCDVEADVKVNRFTLPFYIGQKNAIRLLKLLYVSVYSSILVAVLLGVLPCLSLLTFVTIPRVIKDVNEFTKELKKHISFKYIIDAFIIIMLTFGISVLIGSFL
ncbi:UbiA family prenyltransferase [Erysipelothrix sp. HDW6A]|uniref:UbiA family prenyltransferase n=1 Tax=Erysipelothrix sp. HDW6A TaxID=2714928 RepID=UPI0014094B84|nr:UbiA family prenyltransferase [Erysipelothrix sp. HDW6A]QIK56860.1 UbiA family prenyltransferase [Erysipelothrix sp. HDW6A]